MKQQMLTVLNHYAPDGVVQKAIVSVVWAMEEAGESEEKVIAALASILLDGLQHGNWPR